MKTVHYYSSDHPMVLAQSGDPARGEFRPWERKAKTTKRRRNRRKKGQS